MKAVISGLALFLCIAVCALATGNNEPETEDGTVAYIAGLSLYVSEGQVIAFRKVVEPNNAMEPVFQTQLAPGQFYQIVGGTQVKSFVDSEIWIELIPETYQLPEQFYQIEYSEFEKIFEAATTEGISFNVTGDLNLLDLGLVGANSFAATATATELAATLFHWEMYRNSYKQADQDVSNLFTQFLESWQFNPGDMSIQDGSPLWIRRTDIAELNSWQLEAADQE